MDSKKFSKFNVNIGNVKANRFNENDFERVKECLQDGEIASVMGVNRLTDKEIREYIKDNIHTYNNVKKAKGIRLAVRLENEEYIGTISMYNVNNDKKITVGVFLDRRYRGKGYISSLMEYIKKYLKSIGYTLIMEIAVDNEYSNRMARKIGMKISNVVNKENKQYNIYESI